MAGTKCEKCGAIFVSADAMKDHVCTSPENNDRDKKKKTNIRSAKIKLNKKVLLFAVPAAVVIITAVILILLPFLKLSKATKMADNGEYESAMSVLSGIINTRGAFEQYSKAATALGDECLGNGDEINAALYYLKAGRTIESEQIFDFNSMVMGYSYVSAGISLNGDTYYLTNREGDSQEKGLNAISGMKYFLPGTAGINGTDYSGSPVLHPLDQAGKIYISNASREKLEEETGVIDAISDTRPSDGFTYVVLLKKDGSVKVISDTARPLTSIYGWRKISSICDGVNKIFGIDYSGKLHIAYESEDDKEKLYNVSSFPALQKVVETGKAVIGLTVSGGLCVSYADTDFRYDFDFSEVKNAADITADNNILVITFKDGSVKALRIPNWISDAKDAKLKKVDSVVKTVNRWKNIVRVRFAANGIYGISYDGHVNYTSCDIKYNTNRNKYEFDAHRNIRKKVSGWTDVADVISCTTHAIAIRYDGTAVSTGNTEYLEKRYTSSSSDTYSYVKRTNGTYCDVSSWQLW